VRSSVEIGSEMWICIRYKQTKTNKKLFHLYIYKIIKNCICQTFKQCLHVKIARRKLLCNRIFIMHCVHFVFDHLIAVCNAIKRL
jgi:hypothetical protein